MAQWTPEQSYFVSFALDDYWQLQAMSARQLESVWLACG